MATTPLSSSFPHVHITTVLGDQASNQILYTPTPHTPRGILIYFPGDIQNLHDEMKHTAPQYVEWSLEATTDKLQQRFPSYVIMTIRPARHENLFSEYDHFLRVGHTTRHFRLLLQSFEAHLERECGVELGNLPLLMVGFSKGVIVLNFILSELTSVLHYNKFRSRGPSYLIDWEAPNPLPKPSESHLMISAACVGVDELLQEQDEIISFFNRVREIHYVDGHRFPTEPIVGMGIAKYLQSRNQIGEANSALQTLPCHLYLHVTPRQIADPNREWIQREFRTFERHLTHTLGPNFKAHFYFEKEKKCLTNHFKSIFHFHSPSASS
jgi:hypothetical protein